MVDARGTRTHLGNDLEGGREELVLDDLAAEALNDPLRLKHTVAHATPDEKTVDARDKRQDLRDLPGETQA